MRDRPQALAQARNLDLVSGQCSVEGAQADVLENVQNLRAGLGGGQCL